MAKFAVRISLCNLIMKFITKEGMAGVNIQERERERDTISNNMESTFYALCCVQYLSQITYFDGSKFANAIIIRLGFESAVLGVKLLPWFGNN